MTPGANSNTKVQSRAVPSAITRLQAPALIAGIAGMILSAVGLFYQNGEPFFRGYLIAWLFCLAMSLGSLAIICIGYLTGGEWAIVARRIAEAAALNIVLLAILFIPILFGLHQLFPWARPDQVKFDPILIHKAPYLNPNLFALRAGIYFLIWIAMAVSFRRISIAQERDGNSRKLEERARRISGVGLLLIVLTVTLGMVDWILSRDPHWFSTIIGFAMVVGQMVAGISFCTLMITRVADRDPIGAVITKKHLNDYGNLMMTMVILWAYMSFAQLLIIWMGNVRDDVTWYVDRGMGMVSNGWRWLGLFLIVFHFFVPFFILLSRDSKRRISFLAKMAAWLLAMRIVDLVWLIVPTEQKAFSWMILPPLLGLIGLWLASFVGILKRQTLLPANVSLSAEHEHSHTAHSNTVSHAHSATTGIA